MSTFKNENENQLYSGVAELYLQFRPHYPKAAIERAAAVGGLEGTDRILEVGCGPGTASFPFADYCKSMHCIDPSSGMLNVAKEFCKRHTHLSFEQVSFDEYQGDGNFDAILAGTALHWALESKESIAKIRHILKPGGALILLWNLPFEIPKRFRTAVSKSVQLPERKFIEGESGKQHRANLQETVLGPIEAVGGFTKFSGESFRSSRIFSVEDYLGYLQTLSPCIRLAKVQRNALLEAVRRALLAEGKSFEVESECILNVTHRHETRERPLARR